MRVGILTIYKLNNYGSVLQAYALQSTVNKLGFQGEIIDYSIHHPTPSMLFEYAIHAYQEQGLRLLATSMFHYGIELIQQKIGKLTSRDSNSIPMPDIFDEFRDSHLILSEESYSPEKLRQNPPGYDIYISGSDNVWLLDNRFGVSDGGARYYLDFAPKNSITLSYAPSMGDPIVFDKHLAKLKSLLGNIDFLSVRESSTAEFLSQIAGRVVTTVCDPTLLLSREDWDLLLPEKVSPPSEKPYLLVYVAHQLDFDSPEFQFSRYISQKLGLEVVNIGYHFNEGRPTYSNVTVSEFLTYFKNASLVVTNTFHGTVFSIIYRKGFYAFKPRAGPTRIRDLLSTVGLSERFVQSDLEAQVLSPEIDYRDVEDKIQKFRSESLLWLETALHNEEMYRRGKQ
jgi:hypothetical protein